MWSALDFFRWYALGLEKVMDEAIVIDRAGSVIMEHIMRSNDNTMQWFETIVKGGGYCQTRWYLWWMRRQGTHKSQRNHSSFEQM
jgi:hypothetical protein